MSGNPLQDDPTQPREYLVRLPALYDVATGEVHRATFRLFLYGPQAERVRAKAVMNAAGFFVSRDGIELYLTAGIVMERPEHWAEAFDVLGLTGTYDGLPALAAIQAISLWTSQRAPRRGERGPGKQGQGARDLLLAAVLLRVAQGSSIRSAVCSVLAEYEDVVPWRFETAEASLLQVVKRHLRGSRSFVPSPPNRVR